MNSVVLDVVIGLVFIYLIYSLFISIVGEMISNWLGMRGRVLRQGITNLLTDIQHKNEGFNFLRNLKQYFLYEPAEFKHSKAGEFYEQPSIKYLSQGNRSTIFITKKGKPSYIKKENFTSTLINMLREKGQGIHDWGKVSFSIMTNAMDFDEETSKQLKALLQDADDDMEVFIQKLEGWYDEMMDRINGWYKRKLKFILFWLGFLIVGILNVDSIAIAKKLSKDEAAREQMVALATAATDTTSTIAKMVDEQGSDLSREQVIKTYQLLYQDIEESSLILGQGWDFSALNEPTEEKIARKEIKDSTKFEHNLNKVIKLQDSLNTYESMLDIKGRDYTEIRSLLDTITDFRDRTVNVLHDANLAMKMRFEKIDTFYSEGEDYVVAGNLKPCIFSKIGFILKNGFLPHKKAFWGFVITALALCLGAPFWFDLLKKLVALRSSGIRPKEEKKTIKEQVEGILPKKKSKIGKTINSNDHVDVAIAENKRKWLSIPGVITVNKIQEEVGGKRKNLIEIIADEKCDTDEIISPVKVNIGKKKYKIAIRKITSEKAQLLLGDTVNRNKISNAKTGKNGTCAGLVYNMKSLTLRGNPKKSILSCAHVLESDPSPFFKISKEIINDCNGKSVASVSNQLKSNFLDAAIADLNDQDNTKYDKIPKPYRITSNDWGKAVQVHIGNQQVEAIIKHHAYEYVMTDDYGDYRMFNLIRLGKYDKNKKPVQITEEGDSGALVSIDLGAKGKHSVGIVMGAISNANSPWTFVIPMNEIFRALHLESMPIEEQEKTNP